ncbi:MAG: trypsin-like serine protease, partial [Bacteroidia bacterium]|nr:trypsin-like serine protease [Bacteroidia bacterium]
MAPNFIDAAERTTASVVHIVASQNYARRNNRDDVFREFFGDEFGFRSIPRGPQRSQSSGSGVIISQDGYIVTNNHVVADANDIEVILNDKRSYQAKVVGTAPATDLAVIKIEEKNLPTVLLGNSDEVRVGEWVLAVGNPFNLASTVTAGIVSAKGRSLNILGQNAQAPIEAFIQTDAAVNPGNSGGALINTNGELVGINTAIATPTGTYAGYSFAVPVNIVKKVVNDLVEFGTIQRGFLGVNIHDVDGRFARENDLSITEGVYVVGVERNSAAQSAGIRPGDVIVGIDNKKIRSYARTAGRSSQTKPPAIKLQVKVNRDGKVKTLTVTLRM